MSRTWVGMHRRLPAIQRFRLCSIFMRALLPTSVSVALKRLACCSEFTQMSKNITAANVRLKRAYDPPARDDGARILIDRLWPRGMTKRSAAIDEWFKVIAPSTALRQWFGHDPARWQEFRRRYAGEVRQNPELLAKLRARARQGPITLVFSAHDEVHNDAVVLRDLLLGRSVN
jgi:uncharacterized protein YeaO (DUF488 family)